MKANKLYIKSIQKLGFKAFAIAAFVLLFIVQRIPIFKVAELELSNVSESFSLADIGFLRLVKFFDYFGIAAPAEIEVITYIALGVLVLGLAALVMSFFAYRAVQVINFLVSLVGFLLSTAFGVLMTVLTVGFAHTEFSEIMAVSVNFAVWLPAVLFLIGTIFVYAYAKMPHYSIAEGRFFAAFGAALNPKRFIRTFGRNDDTEQIFRSRVPLKKKKYATLSEPKAVKKSKKAVRKARKKSGEGLVQDNKNLTKLEIALKKREHAEKLANARADEENRALYKNKKIKPAAAKKAAPKPPPRPRRSTAEREKALNAAKRRVEHAEAVAMKEMELSE